MTDHWEEGEVGEANPWDATDNNWNQEQYDQTGEQEGWAGTGDYAQAGAYSQTQTQAMETATRLTKHLDASRGQFYYYDNDTGVTTWDSPMKHIPLHVSEEQALRIATLHKEIAQTKALQSRARLDIIDTMMDDRQLAKAKDDAEKIRQMNRHSLNEWDAGLLIAANEGYDCNMSWKEIPRIEPVLYDFEKTFGHRLRALRLVGIKLKEVPDELGRNLPGLEILNMSNNQLTTLPDSIVYMTSLTQLSVLHNVIETLPQRIGLMCNMRRLEISNNRLKTLPDTFAALTQIKRLDLESNCLRLLPENLDLMVKLETLNVNKNRLLRLPRCLHRMPSLTLLTANKNCISYIPNDIVKSRTIEKLSLCNNDLTSLPERLGEMICLKELALDFNKLSFLPMTFYLLENLTRLRVEGNPALCSPGDDVITAGAKSVVSWCRARFVEDQQSRMRRIIFTVQDTLRQLHDRGLADLTKFDDEFYWKEDMCYVFNMDWFFAYVVPTMNRTWAREASKTRHKERRKTPKSSSSRKALALMGGNETTSSASPVKQRDFVDDTIINDFPFTRPEVMWAFTHYFDANGPVYTQGKVFYKRCGCVDANGRRFPCVPPKKGYMCNTKAYILKKQIVLKKEKERRLWEKMKKAAVLEAGLRAEQESIQYLESDAGRLWVAEMSYEKGENEIENKGLEAIVDRRRKQCEKKKAVVIKKFDKKKAAIKKALDAKSGAIQKQLEEAKELLKTAHEGYIKEATTTRIYTLSEELANFPEHEVLLSLQDECMQKCQDLEDEYFKRSSSSEGEGTAGEESAEDNFWETPQERADRLALEEREVKALAIRTAGKETGGQTKADRDNQKREEKRARKELKQKRSNEKKLKRAKMIQRMRREYKHVIDRVHLKYSYIKLLMNGEFSEAQKELQHHIFQEYVQHNVAKARRAAEREYFVMGKIRRQWGGLGLETSFYQWKDFVKYNRSERRKDARRKWRQDVKNFESGMICVHLAEAQISLWEKSTDIYTDTPYWKNWQSGDIMWAEPTIETYMPLGFKFPDPPPPLPEGIGEDTTEPSEEEKWDDSDDGLDFLTVMKADDPRAATAGSSADNRMDALKGRSGKTVSRSGSRRRRRRKLPDNDEEVASLGVSELGSESIDKPVKKIGRAHRHRKHKKKRKNRNNSDADVWTNDDGNESADSDSSSSDESDASGSSGDSTSKSSRSASSKSTTTEDEEEKVNEDDKNGDEWTGLAESFDSVNAIEKPLLLRVDSNVSSIPDVFENKHDEYANTSIPLDEDQDIADLSQKNGDSPSRGIGMDGNFQPRRWPLGQAAEISLRKSMSFGAADVDSPSPGAGAFKSKSFKHVSFSPMHSQSMDISEEASDPFNSTVDSTEQLPQGKLVVAPTNDLGIPMLPGAGRLQIFTESFSYGPDSLRAGLLRGRVGRPSFQEEIVETEEEKKRRMMKEKTEEAAKNAASTSTLLSSLTDGQQKKVNKYDSGNAQELLDALEGGSDVSETAARARLAEIRAQIKHKHKTEVHRAKFGLKQKEKDVNTVRHETYMKQRNRRPRMAQGLFDPRVKKEKESKYYEPASTFDLLHMAGGNYDMTRQGPMDVMTALATKAVKLKKKLREEAEKESLIPKKESDFYHDHIDVIVRENYVSSDSEEEELAKKIKAARLNTARMNTAKSNTGRPGTNLSRAGTAATNVSSTGNGEDLKLPSISRTR